jgi:hypothetical protein
LLPLLPKSPASYLLTAAVDVGILLRLHTRRPHSRTRGASRCPRVVPPSSSSRGSYRPCTLTRMPSCRCCSCSSRDDFSRGQLVSQAVGVVRVLQRGVSLTFRSRRRLQEFKLRPLLEQHTHEALPILGYMRCGLGDELCRRRAQQHLGWWRRRHRRSHRHRHR